MNRQALHDWVVADHQDDQQSKVEIFSQLSQAYDYSTIAMLCEYMMDGYLPQHLPAAAPPSVMHTATSRKRKKTG